MKLRLSDAARSLGVHPANLLLYLAELGVPFQDVWPEVDSTWLEAARGQDWNRFARPSTPPSKQAAPVAKPEATRSALSQAAAHILEKMWRQGRWGDLSLALETVRKHYVTAGSDPDAAIRELVDLGLVVSGGTRGPFSLNSSRKGDIERLATALVGRGTKP